MKKVLKLDRFLNFAAVLLVIGFILRFAADYYKIQVGASSAPLYIFFTERMLEFLLPGILCFAASAIVRKAGK